MSRRNPEPAQSITSAPEPLGADQARRARRYLIQMGIRVVCFVVAVLTWTRVPGWVSLVLIVGAVVLPYIAVLFANAGRERRDVGPVGYVPHQLDAAPPTRPVAAAPPGSRAAGDDDQRGEGTWTDEPWGDDPDPDAPDRPTPPGAPGDDTPGGTR
ncbi:DUF3099 domain-containing protein [Cellulomonas pakistanensis]|uniref:DUF3099 domain-containing protein n=1 Tax=Cellulomonas pakistanensis TaxID=992287 RepID=A0A919P9T9_9CELL|nr:DUF3099 domain-containing protein [Cellulomonas pakistanensis]GIG35630.1 hypothetical protein Cpa01nite_10110 [Cellulomonas pakistanensis]